PRHADVRSDLYSLGCSLYCMLVGQPPFPNGTVLQKLLQHQGDEPPDPRTLRADLPMEVVRIIRKLLSKSPGQRHQRPVDLITELRAVRERLLDPSARGVAVAWPLARPMLSDRWRRHLPWALPLAALVVISVVL